MLRYQIYLPRYDIDFYAIKGELESSGFPQRRGYFTFTRIQGIQGGGQPRCQCSAVILTILSSQMSGCDQDHNWNYLHEPKQQTVFILLQVKEKYEHWHEHGR